MTSWSTEQTRRGCLLGIDHGTSVIGLAMCDALWIAARPLALLHRTTRSADFDKIKAIIAQHAISAIVVGLPDNPEPERGIDQAQTVHRWATRLAAAITLPVYLWEEQFSSHEAMRLSAEAELPASPTANRIDDRAAAVILQSFIDAHPVGATLSPPLKQRR